ncbi:hypothetical protein VP01_1255g2 [Puccinia sorghi]|uniref:Uncharacterized protein n=1 Tax=Puccinia sorghi TaxID=27349 RepID=A0A0L6VPK5_9BASI|nr:hypothetical protein VP01_1255g2 [Puccinia sorghi]
MGTPLQCQAGHVSVWMMARPQFLFRKIEKQNSELWGKGVQHATHPLWICKPQDVAALVQVGRGTNFQYANGDHGSNSYNAEFLFINFLGGQISTNLMIIVSIPTLFRVRNSMVKFISPKKIISCLKHNGVIYLRLNVINLLILGAIILFFGLPQFFFTGNYYDQISTPICVLKIGSANNLDCATTSCGSQIQSGWVACQTPKENRQKWTEIGKNRGACKQGCFRCFKFPGNNKGEGMAGIILKKKDQGDRLESWRVFCDTLRHQDQSMITSSFMSPVIRCLLIGPGITFLSCCFIHFSLFIINVFAMTRVNKIISFHHTVPRSWHFSPNSESSLLWHLSPIECSYWCFSDIKSAFYIFMKNTFRLFRQKTQQKVCNELRGNQRGRKGEHFKSVLDHLELMSLPNCLGLPCGCTESCGASHAVNIWVLPVVFNQRLTSVLFYYYLSPAMAVTNLSVNLPVFFDQLFWPQSLSTRKNQSQPRIIQESTQPLSLFNSLFLSFFLILSLSSFLFLSGMITFQPVCSQTSVLSPSFLSFLCSVSQLHIHPIVFSSVGFYFLFLSLNSSLKFSCLYISIFTSFVAHLVCTEICSNPFRMYLTFLCNIVTLLVNPLVMIKCMKEFIGLRVFNDLLHQTPVFVEYCDFILEIIINYFSDIHELHNMLQCVCEHVQEHKALIAVTSMYGAPQRHTGFHREMQALRWLMVRFPVLVGRCVQEWPPPLPGRWVIWVQGVLMENKVNRRPLCETRRGLPTQRLTQMNANALSCCGVFMYAAEKVQVKMWWQSLEDFGGWRVLEGAVGKNQTRLSSLRGSGDWAAGA